MRLENLALYGSRKKVNQLHSVISNRDINLSARRLLLTLGAHAQRGLQYLVCVSVCLFVCLSVDDYSRTTGYEAAYERYQQLQCYKGMKNNVAILLKRLRSRDMA